MNQPEFGHVLVRVRKAKGLTQSELAEKCDVSKRTIQRLESGSVTPRSFTIRTLSDALEYDFFKTFSDDYISEMKTVEDKRFILINQITAQIADLFNLKTNTMKKLSILTVVFGLIGFGIFTYSNKSFSQTNLNFTDFGVMDPVTEISKKDAVKVINGIERKAKYHNGALDIIKTFAKKSNYNQDTYVLLAKLASSFGHSTEPVTEIASIVFLTHKECELFNEIAPLIFLNNQETDNYVNLAREAKDASTETKKKKIREQIAKYKQQAEYKTLEEAFKNQDML